MTTHLLYGDWGRRECKRITLEVVSYIFEFPRKKAFRHFYYQIVYLFKALEIRRHFCTFA